MECASGEVCVAEMCRPGTRCREPSDCGAMEVCTSGVCEPDPGMSCSVDGDCDAGEYCDAGLCAPSNTCAADAECATGFWCEGGSCVPEGSAGECRDNADCTSEQVCVEDLCREREDVCQFDRECPAGLVCLNSECTRICTDSTVCASGDTCQGGFCQAADECTTSAECATGESCVGGRCLPACAGTVCTESGAYCAPDGFCRPEFEGEPFCTMDSECNTGRVCRSGVCRTPCADMSDMTCMLFDSQVPNCELDSTSGEYLCHTDSELMPECVVAADCTAGQNCLDGICRNP